MHDFYDSIPGHLAENLKFFTHAICFLHPLDKRLVKPVQPLCFAEYHINSSPSSYCLHQRLNVPMAALVVFSYNTPELKLQLYPQFPIPSTQILQKTNCVFHRCAVVKLMIKRQTRRILEHIACIATQSHPPLLLRRQCENHRSSNAQVFRRLELVLTLTFVGSEQCKKRQLLLTDVMR